MFLPIHVVVIFSPSDLEADFEDNQDYDSTVSQSETNLTTVGNSSSNDGSQHPESPVRRAQECAASRLMKQSHSNGVHDARAPVISTSRERTPTASVVGHCVLFTTFTQPSICIRNWCLILHNMSSGNAPRFPKYKQRKRKSSRCRCQLWSHSCL